MPEADGYVRISTKLDDSALTRQLSTLGAKLNKQLSGLEKAKQNVEALERAMEKLSSGETTPRSITNLEKEIERSEKDLDRMNKQLDALSSERKGLQDANVGGMNDAKIADLNDRIETMSEKFVESANHVEELNAKLSELRADPTKTTEAEELARQLDTARSEVERMSADVDNTKVSMDALRNSTAGVEQETTKTTRAVGGLTAYIKRLAKRMLLLYAFRRVFTYIRNSIMSMSGLSVVTGAFTEFNNKMKEAYQSNTQIQAALAKLRGALYLSFQPIYQAVVPALVTLINWLARGVQYIAAFFSALSGKKLNDSADGAKNLAKSIGGVGGAAKQANKQLATFDKLNTLSENSGGGGGGGSGSGATDFDVGGDAEKVALFEKIGERIRLVIQRIKDAYSEFMEWWAQASPGQKAVVLAVALGILIPLLFTLLSWPKAMIATLIVLVAVVETYYEQITGWLYGASDAIANFFSDGIADFQNVIKQVKEWLTEHLGFLGTFLGTLFTLVGGAIELVWNLVGDAVKLIIDTVTALVETIHSIATGDWTKAWEAWGTVVEDVWDGIKHIVVTVANTVVGIIADLWNAFAGWLNGIAELINAAGSLIGLNWDLSIPTWDFKGFASGGFPAVGSMFLAGEAGPELVGSFGGHNNAVINEAQLVGAFKQASAEQTSLLQQQNALLNAILNKSNEFTFKPSSAAGRAFQQSLNMYNRAMG